MEHSLRDQYSTLINALPSIQKRLGVHFYDETLLIQAFVHKSFANESSFPISASYERLEFLGDSILNLIVAEHLFLTEPASSEGELSQKKSQWVSQKSCAQTIDTLDISHYMLTGKGEQLKKIFQQEAVQADLFESIAGALFLDQGWEKAKEFVMKTHCSRCHLIQLSHENPKAALQEWCLKQKLGLPKYNVIKEHGPQHDPTFTVGVFVQEALIIEAQGKSKRHAEVEAAKEALVILTNKTEKVT
jgi:ribonuclease-3